MKELVKIIYWILLPALDAYVFLLISPQQPGVEAAQRTIHARIFLVIFVTLFLWGFGNALLGGWKDAANRWESLGVLGYQYQTSFARISIVLATLAMLFGIALIVSDAVIAYLPEWVVYHPLIVGFALIVEAVSLTKYALDILNTGNSSS
jgi:hypothetical protein